MPRESAVQQRCAEHEYADDRRTDDLEAVVAGGGREGQDSGGDLPAGRDEQETTAVLTTPIYLDSISTDSRLFTKIIARPSIQPAAKRWPDVEVTIELKKGKD